MHAYHYIEEMYQNYKNFSMHKNVCQMLLRLCAIRVLIVKWSLTACTWKVNKYITEITFRALLWTCALVRLFQITTLTEWYIETILTISFCGNVNLSIYLSIYINITIYSFIHSSIYLFIYTSTVHITYLAKDNVSFLCWGGNL